MTLNGSVFYYIFSDLQVQNFDAVAIQFQTGNASELTSKGVDLDFNWAPNIDGLTLFGGLAYTDTKFSDVFDPNPNNADDTENLQGRAGARAPEWAGNIGADWRIPVANGLELGLTGTMSFSSSYWTNTQSFTDLKQSGYVTFDLVASIGDPEGT